MTIMIRATIITPMSPPITPPAIAPTLEEVSGGGSVVGSDGVGVVDGG